MADPPNLTKFTDECYHCQEMFSAHSAELLLYKILAHNKKIHGASDEQTKREKVSAVERDCLPRCRWRSGSVLSKTGAYGRKI